MKHNTVNPLIYSLVILFMILGCIKESENKASEKGIYPMKSKTASKILTGKPPLGAVRRHDTFKKGAIPQRRNKRCERQV